MPATTEFSSFTFSSIEAFLELNETFDDVTQSAVISSNLTSYDRDVMVSQRWLSGVFVVLYGAIFLLGLSGNALVVYVVARNRAMQTITNTFITNLAVSDIMMCLFAVPFTPAAALLNSWHFGETLCHLVPMTLGVSVHVSTLTSTAIAIDRYFVIVHPFKPRMSLSSCLTLIVAIWITSVSISLPLAIYQKVSRDPFEDIEICHEKWPTRTSRQFFTVTSFVLQYVIPCALIAYCYTRVSLVLRSRACAKIGTGSRTRDREELELKRKRRTNRMLIAMVSIFGCCWLPLNTLHVVHEYSEQYGSASDLMDYYLLLFLSTHVVAMSSTVYNPFLYAWMNENFRKEFQLVLPKWCPVGSGGDGGEAAVGGGAQKDRGPQSPCTATCDLVDQRGVEGAQGSQGENVCEGSDTGGAEPGPDAQLLPAGACLTTESVSNEAEHDEMISMALQGLRGD